MDWSVIWKVFILAISGIAILKMSGRKSLAQMTMPEIIVMVSIGTLIVEPIVAKSVSQTVLILAVYVAVILILEFIQLKWNGIEKLITGKSIIIIENGTLHVQNLKKLRLTVDQLEMRLRNAGISKMDDIKIGTIEPNGELGYELKDEAKPVTVGDLKKLLGMYQPQDSTSPNLFTEIQNPSEKHQPDYLQ